MGLIDKYHRLFNEQKQHRIDVSPVFLTVATVGEGKKKISRVKNLSKYCVESKHGTRERGRERERRSIGRTNTLILSIIFSIVNCLILAYLAPTHASHPCYSSGEHVISSPNGSLRVSMWWWFFVNQRCDLLSSSSQARSTPPCPPYNTHISLFVVFVEVCAELKFASQLVSVSQCSSGWSVKSLVRRSCSEKSIFLIFP